MTYREFMQKICSVYKMSSGLINIYNDAFKGQEEFADYWNKFVNEYYSSDIPPMPSFWLKEQINEMPSQKEDRSKMYNLAEKTKELLHQQMLDKFGSGDDTK